MNIRPKYTGSWSGVHLHFGKADFGIFHVVLGTASAGNQSMLEISLRPHHGINCKKEVAVYIEGYKEESKIKGFPSAKAMLEDRLKDEEDVWTFLFEIDPVSAYRMARQAVVRQYHVGVYDGKQSLKRELRQLLAI